MACLPSNRQHQAIGKANRRPPPKLRDRHGNRFWFLQRQLVVVQEHLDRGCDRFGTTVVDRRKYPRGFGKREMRDPCAVGDKSLGSGDLLRIISSDQPDQDVRVNGAHGAS